MRAVGFDIYLCCSTSASAKTTLKTFASRPGSSGCMWDSNAQPHRYRLCEGTHSADFESAMGFNRLDFKTTGDDEQRKTAPVKTKCLVFVKSNLLLLAMFVGIAVGVAMGFGLNSLDPKLTGPQVAYVRFPGDLFIQLMKMLLIPIVVSSLLCSVAEIDIRSSGKIGLRALGYYLGTLVLASALAIVLALTIRPGDRLSGRVGGGGASYTLSTNPGLVFMDLIRNMIPDNLMEVFSTAKKTSFVYRDVSVPDVNESLPIQERNVTESIERVAVSLRVETVSGTNMIGLVVTSILFGCVTSVAGAEARLFLDFFRAVRCVSFRLLALFIWYAPIGIAFLIASKMSELDDPATAFKSLGIFVGTVMTGLLLHSCVVYPLIYLIVVRKNPFRFCAGILPAVLFAFGSESSAATLPLTIKCLEEKNGVDPRVTKLIASVGATVNMDGSCLYFTLMTIFVAQLNNIPLSAADIATVSVMAISMTIGAAGVPGMAFVGMIMILSSVGLPAGDIGTLLSVDWLLARFRTSINVLGDGYGAGIIEKLSQNDLKVDKLDTSANGFPDNEQRESPADPVC